LQDYLLHHQSAAVHALYDVLCCCYRTSNDMYLNLKAHTAHTQRLLDISLSVDAEFLFQNVQYLLVARLA
jgi:hypothetical protein